ncbi:hypothetical protein LR48_Vigan682s000400 [Vigna angularis]|uniref:Transposase (putative) gypsy type domain-containing protein n=1 Tax=Phaseolus angularis TaxID=3914 RepID=A0A0L9TFN0_PHAAN|nr:hypothetical protein LR48_Vigan682s000400 [Vigna angularis]
MPLCPPLLISQVSGFRSLLLNFLLCVRVEDLRKILRCQSQFESNDFFDRKAIRLVAVWVAVHPDGKRQGCVIIDIRMSGPSRPTLPDDEWQVHIESSSESSGGVRGGSARGDSERGASPSSVSLSFLEETVRSSGREPRSPDAAGNRIIHGIPIFLLKGDIRIDGSPYEPDGDAYGTRELLEWRVNRTHVVRDVEDSRLIRAGANVAPAQLHPNSWAAMQAFLAMCLAMGVTPTIPVFFHYFEVRPPPQGGWVSLTSVRDRTLFCPFSDSLKNFKHHYFKVIIDAVDRHEFYDSARNPLFPFYWTRVPRKIKAFPVGVLGSADLEAVRTINAFPRRISDRHLVECLRHEDCERKAFDLMTAPAPRQSNFMPPRSEPRPVRHRPGRRGRRTLLALLSGLVPAGWAPAADPLPGLAAVSVDPSFEATTASAAPLVRKRKDLAGEGHKDKEASSSRSASKKARKGKEKVPSMSLPGGIFSPAFSMSDRTKFHMSSSQRALIEPLSEAELTNAMVEMSTWAASLTWYLKEFADRRGWMTSALNSWPRNRRLLEECSQLKTKVTRQRSFEVGLLKANQALTDDLARARERISELEAGIVFEHEEGFNKALRQAFVLVGIHEPFTLGFDIEKDVFDGVLVDLNSMVDDEGPEIEGPSGAAGADEAVEVEDEDKEADDGDN